MSDEPDKPPADAPKIDAPAPKPPKKKRIDKRNGKNAHAPKAKKDAWHERFFEQLEKTKCISDACVGIGINVRTVYRVRDRDEKFRNRWDDIIRRVDDQLEASALKRAIEGNVSYLFHKGQPVLVGGKLVPMRTYETGLTIFMLKKRRPDVYADDYYGGGGSTGGATATELAAEVRRALAESSDIFVAPAPAPTPIASDVDPSKVEPPKTEGS